MPQYDQSGRFAPAGRGRNYLEVCIDSASRVVRSHRESAAEGVGTYVGMLETAPLAGIDACRAETSPLQILQASSGQRDGVIETVLSPEPAYAGPHEKLILENPTTMRLIAALLGGAIFLIDTLSPLEGAVAVLYVLVVLVAARSGLPGDLFLSSYAVAALTIGAFVWSHGVQPTGSSAMRALVSLAAIGIAAMLAYENVSATRSLLEANDALRRSERRYRRMFSTSRIGVLEEDWSAVRRMTDELARGSVVDIARKLADEPDIVERTKGLPVVVAANPEALKILGKTDSTSIGTLDRVLAPNDDTFADALVAFAQGASSFEGETELRRDDGSTVPVLFSLTFPSAQHEEPVLAFMIDISERRQAQEAMLAAQAELAHAARVATLGELTASITHEVNQPLTAIVTSGDAALRWLNRPEPNLAEAASSVSHAVSEGKRASAIVHRIRGFLAKTPTARTRLRIAHVLGDGARLIERDLAQHDVDLRLDIARGLPPINGDAVEIQQVVVNLLLNAAQAMAKSPEPRIATLTARRSEGGVLITVADTGPGIATDDVESLFRPFFTTKRDGMGMGLAICRSIVTSHGGRLWATSENGAGAQFHVLLPGTCALGMAPTS